MKSLILTATAPAALISTARRVDGDFGASPVTVGLRYRFDG
jgi:hypothetical protein